MRSLRAQESAQRHLWSAWRVSPSRPAFFALKKTNSFPGHVFWGSHNPLTSSVGGSQGAGRGKLQQQVQFHLLHYRARCRFTLSSQSASSLLGYCGENVLQRKGFAGRAANFVASLVSAMGEDGPVSPNGPLAFQVFLPNQIHIGRSPSSLERNVRAGRAANFVASLVFGYSCRTKSTLVGLLHRLSAMFVLRNPTSSS